MATKILRCECLNTYQDQKYGKFNRVMNKQDKLTDTYECTVCGKAHKSQSKKSEITVKEG